MDLFYNESYKKNPFIEVLDPSSLIVPNHPPEFTAVSRTPFSIDIEWDHVANSTLNALNFSSLT